MRAAPLSLSALSFSETRTATAVACLSIHAAAEPGTLPRLLEQLALRSLVPERCHVSRTERDALQVDIQVAGMTHRDADKLAAALRRGIDVESVLVWMKDG